MTLYHPLWHRSETSLNPGSYEVQRADIFGALNSQPRSTMAVVIAVDSVETANTLVPWAVSNLDAGRVFHIVEVENIP